MSKFKVGDKVRRLYPNGTYPEYSTVIGVNQRTSYPDVCDFIRLDNAESLGDPINYELVEASPTNEELRKLVVAWKQNYYATPPPAVYVNERALYDAAVSIEEQDRPKPTAEEIVKEWLDKNVNKNVGDLIEKLQS